MTELVQFFANRTESSVPVLGINQMYLGMLDIDRVAEAVAARRWELQAASLMDSEAQTLKPSGLLEHQVAGLDRSGGDVVPIVDASGQLQGILDLRALNARVTLARHRGPGQAFDDAPTLAQIVDLPPGSVRDSYV